MYLVDTNVISEARKGPRADAGVSHFLRDVAASATPVFLAAVTVGELRRGVEAIRHRGDVEQARRLGRWLDALVDEYGSRILPLDIDAAQVWGRLVALRPQHLLDKQIAAIALIHGLTVVTRNTADFAGTGVPLTNPFAADVGPPHEAG